MANGLEFNDPVLSVVIPTCNRDRALKRAIWSILLQEVRGLEVIVVNDGDKDLPLLELPSSDVHIRFVRTTGRCGPAAARNYGVKEASGKYVTFLDDDDIYMPGRLANMLGVMQSSDYVLVSSGRFYEKDDFRVIENVPRQKWGVIAEKDIKFANDIDIGFMCQRADFLEIGGFDSSFTNLEDWDFIIRILRRGVGFKIERRDYCVNAGTDRSRVSGNDFIGYGELAEKHRSYYGKEWYSFMLAMAARLNRTLSIRLALKYAFSGRSCAPLSVYLRSVYRRAIRKGSC